MCSDCFSEFTGSHAWTFYWENGEERQACLKCCRKWFGKNYRERQSFKGVLYARCVKEARAQKGLILPVPELHAPYPNLDADQNPNMQFVLAATQSPWPNGNNDGYSHLDARFLAEVGSASLSIRLPCQSKYTF